MKRVFERWDLNCSVVGRVTKERSFLALYGGREMARVPISALASEAPVYDRPAERPQNQDELQSLDLKKIPQPEDLGLVLKRLMESPNLASKEWIYRQYDHFVRGNTLLAPGGNAAVLRIKGSRTGLALTVDGNGRYCYLDPYVGAVLTVAEAARNLACVGARPVGLSDCLNFGSPESPAVMWQFSRVIEGLRDGCTAMGVPVVSGNVSFYNETEGVPIYPTPIVGMVGVLSRAERYMTPWFKSEGDVVVLLGYTREELGGSEYLKVVHGLVRGTPPWIDLKLERAVQRCCLRAIERGILRSAHDVADGGLAVALVECCISGPEKLHGVRIELGEGMRMDAQFFGESQSRIVVSVKPRDLSRLKEIATKEAVPLQVIGEVGGSRFTIRPVIGLTVEELKSIWTGVLEKNLH